MFLLKTFLSPYVADVYWVSFQTLVKCLPENPRELYEPFKHHRKHHLNTLEGGFVVPWHWSSMVLQWCCCVPRGDLGLTNTLHSSGVSGFLLHYITNRPILFIETIMSQARLSVQYSFYGDKVRW
jgi:hypothetical protein